MADLRILSLGISPFSTLALMIEKGEIPMVSCGIFSEWENQLSFFNKYFII